MFAHALVVSLGCVASSQSSDKKKQSEAYSKNGNIKTITSKKEDKKILVNSDELEEITESLKQRLANLIESKVIIKESTMTSKELKVKEELKSKANVKEATDGEIKMNPDDFQTIVEVKVAGGKKKFFFKNMDKVINGERYKCKIGYNENNFVAFVRYTWVGHEISTTPESKVNDDLAAFFELS